MFSLYVMLINHFKLTHFFYSTATPVGSVCCTEENILQGNIFL